MLDAKNVKVKSPATQLDVRVPCPECDCSFVATVKLDKDGQTRGTSVAYCRFCKAFVGFEWEKGKIKR